MPVVPPSCVSSLLNFCVSFFPCVSSWRSLSCTPTSPVNSEHSSLPTPLQGSLSSSPRLRDSAALPLLVSPLNYLSQPRGPLRLSDNFLCSGPRFPRAHRWRRSAPSSAASTARRRQGCSGPRVGARSCCAGRRGAGSAGRPRRLPPGPGARQGRRRLRGSGLPCSRCCRARPVPRSPRSPFICGQTPARPSAAGVVERSRAEPPGATRAASPPPHPSPLVSQPQTHGGGGGGNRRSQLLSLPPTLCLTWLAPSPVSATRASPSHLHNP